MADVKTLTGLVDAKMAESGTTKQELAAKLGIKSTQTLNAKLASTSDLTLFEGQKLADFCGITLESLCTLAIPEHTPQGVA